MASLEIMFAGTTGDASIARLAVKGLLDERSDAERVDDALLMTSELVSNAALHTKAVSVLRAEFADSLLRVEVTDGSDVVPQPGCTEPTVLGGRGLRLVNDLATQWGVTRISGGKTIWFELQISTRT